MVVDSTDIPDLMMAMLSVNNDSYGKDAAPSFPLPFDCVDEGQPPHSTTPLLNLPVEILGEIIEYIDLKSLASLALVNRHCRRLARSWQFASIKFDFSDSTFALINALLAESADRAGNGGSVRAPSLGVYIRRITVAAHASWVTHRHDICLDETYIGLEKSVRVARLDGASNVFYATYIPAIRRLLSNRTTLPHLDSLDWDDSIALSPSFFNDLARSSLRHLKLSRVYIEEELSVELPDTYETQQWPLRSLRLQLLPSLTRMDVLSYPTCTSILRLCSATLETLRWDAATSMTDPERTESVASGHMPQFNRLRHLRLCRIKIMSFPMLDALVHDGIRTLDVNTEISPVYSEFFQKRGRIPSLEAFIGSTLYLSKNHHLAFLRANVQLLRLSLPNPTPDTLLETQLLPLLCSSFPRLESISLVWNSLSIPESALEMLGSLTSLKKIHLSAGYQTGRRYDWLIDHEKMRKYLHGLPLLEKIAFSRDSYDIGLPGAEVQSYYEDRILVWAAGKTSEEYEMEWEMCHRARIADEARQYVDRMPKLDWLYFGQIAMEVAKAPDTDQRIPCPLSQYRDSCWSLLRKMFGGTTD